MKPGLSCSVLLGAFASLTLAGNVQAQPFTEVNAGLAAVSQGGIQWGDYNQDGKPDLLLVGLDAQWQPLIKVYRNDGNQTFADISAAITPLAGATAAWGDYDKDGFLDILSTSSSWPDRYTKLYHYQGNDSFELAGSGLPENAGCLSAAFGDYNNDGYPDLLLAGCIEGSSSYNRLYRNEGGHFVPGPSTVPDLRPSGSGALAWGDYDQDGFLDLLFLGAYALHAQAQIWGNQRNGTFALVTGLAQSVFADGWAAWGDYDNDGFPDLAFNGGEMGIGSFQLYHNLQHGSFMQVNAPQIIETFSGPVAWADYNNDGKLDLLVGGSHWIGPNHETEPVTKIYRNQGGGSFVEENSGIVQLEDSAAAWGDYNNDGNLDLVVMGRGQAGPVTKLYRNDLPYTVSGQVTQSGSGLGGVSLSLMGRAPYSVNSGADGSFNFPAVLPGDYVLIPAKANFVFEPANIGLTLHGSGASGKNFTAFSDRDADGLKDSDDSCPDDPLKYKASLCDCGVPDWDNNGRINCNVARSFKNTLAALNRLVKKLKHPRGPNDFTLQQALALNINQGLSRAQMLASSGIKIKTKGKVKLGPATSKMIQKVVLALQVENKKFQRNKSLALQSVAALLAALV